MEKKVAVILLNYRHYAEKYLVECLAGLKKQSYQGPVSWYIVDNATSDRSYDFLLQTVPQAQIIRNENNDGFAKGNNDAIKAARRDGCKYLILFNMDTVIDPKAIEELVDLADRRDDVGAVQSRLMLWPDRTKVNSLGNSTHFLGFGYCLNYRDDYEKLTPSDGSDIFYPSGAAVLLKSELLDKIGLFDDSYFMYNEDQDLGWRIWLAGYRCVIALKSVVYHKYEFVKSISQYYYMDRNRLITILKNYHIATLILIFPAALIMELGLLFFSIFNGWFFEKLKVWSYFLRPSTWKKIGAARKKIQSDRVFKDSDLINLISSRISYQEIDSWALRLANLFFDLYYSILRWIIKQFKI